MARGNKAKRDAFVSIPAEVKEMLRHLHPAIQHMPKPERMDGVGAEMRHAAYAKGAKVTYKGEHYICKMDNCVWNPELAPQFWDLVA